MLTIMCPQCGQVGHIARNCSTGGSSFGGGFNNNSYGGGAPRGDRQRTCYNCGGVGHMARMCSLVALSPN